MLVAGAVAGTMFLLSYVRAGRFGAMILSLGAGYMLAELWADSLTAGYGAVQLGPLSWSQIIYASTVLGPGVFALLFSHKKKSLVPRIVGAAVAAVFALALLLTMLAAGSDTQVVAVLREYKEAIITAALVMGLLDTVFARPPKAPKHTKD